MVVAMKHLFVVMCLISSAVNNRDVKRNKVVPFNLTHIVLQSALYCGPSFLCDQSLLTHIGIPVATGSSFSSCGTCSCYEQCYKIANCCPDLYFKYGNMVCNDLLLVDNHRTGTLYSANDQTEMLYSLIEACPTDANATLTDNCKRGRSKFELMQNPPVSSRKTKRTYKNQHCAVCNNVTDLISWELMFECHQATDFNYLSSFKEILKVAETKRCKVLFSPSSPFFQKCSPLEANIISSCNIFGTWHRYDPSIEQACLSGYYARIGVFKNIFCAMCNPPSIDPSRSRNNCKNRSSVYHTACEELPSIEASFPYKNHYCHMCDEGNDVEPINDVVLIQTKEVYDRRLFQPLTITINFNFKNDRIKEHIEQLIRTFNTSDTVPLSHAVPVNISNLVRTSFALSSTGVCTPSLLPNYTSTLQEQCSCEIGCRYDCCDDFAVTQPWACVNEFYPSRNLSKYSSANYLMVAGCVEQHEKIGYWCTNRNLSDFYQLFPVNDWYSDGTTYANIFCYLCNKKQTENLYSIISGTAVWGLIVECKTYINYRYFNSMQSFINFAQINDCELKIEPRQNSEKCKEVYPISKVYVSKCNSYGSWNAVDLDVQFACEVMEDYRFPKVISKNVIYKNKFCLVCNPTNIEPNGIDSCKYSNSTPTAVYRACREFPDVQVCSYFRNVFCEMCNGIFGNCFNVHDETVGPGTFPPTVFPTFPPIAPPGFRSCVFNFGLHWSVNESEDHVLFI